MRWVLVVALNVAAFAAVFLLFYAVDIAAFQRVPRTACGVFSGTAAAPPSGLSGCGLQQGRSTTPPQAPKDSGGPDDRVCCGDGKSCGGESEQHCAGDHQSP
ncbi:hypothetical protein [Streptomyces fructofermentans]|uniref:Uncharacterized protein n=1 Tax=Streptomyces fructofermentans TaxID=152141 RepID=A0A918KP87_9ACTN|nr:hypothetical protein [Streptomyces fructofermentans]GGX69526.1 hypothetical protein GCM10010515_41460 [Streptomyces fructofermentans]